MNRIVDIDETHKEVFINFCKLVCDLNATVYSEDKLHEFWLDVLNNDAYFGQLLVNDTYDVVGFFVGYLGGTIINDEVHATHTQWYVLEGYRNTPKSLQLLKNFENWCKIKGVKQIYVTIPTDSPLFNRLQSIGYSELETTYRKVLE